MDEYKKTIIVLLSLLAFIAGCGQSIANNEPGFESTTKQTQSAQSTSDNGFGQQVRNVTVYLVNNVPEADANFRTSAYYIQEQLDKFINPIYSINATVAISTNPPQGSPTVILESGPGTDFHDGRGPLNTYLLANVGHVKYNSVTTNEHTVYARIDHMVEDLVVPLIGQKYEFRDYSPKTFKEELLDGEYWLCDFEMPDGSSFLITHNAINPPLTINLPFEGTKYLFYKNSSLKYQATESAVYVGWDGKVIKWYQGDGEVLGFTALTPKKE
jgi:hypothetical protein